MSSSELTQAKMEAILGSDSEPFKTFLKDHYESSEEAKSMFKLIKEKEPNSLALKLAAFLESSHDLYYREECAKLLRKLFTDDDDLWHNHLSVSTQSRIKCFLLHLLPLEESASIIQELRCTVYPLAVSFLPYNKWPELLAFLYLSLTDPTSNNYLKEHVFYLFADLAVKIGETIVPCVKYLHSIFRNTLKDDTFNLHVRKGATIAVIKFIQCVPVSSKEKERFQELLPGTLRTLTDGLSNRYHANRVLNNFILLAENQPKFLRSQLVDVVNTMMEIAKDAKLEDKTRHLAVEFVLSLVEARKAPGMMRKLPLFTHTFFAILLNFLLDIEDEPSWHSADNVFDQAGTTDNYQSGQNFLYRLSKALGGKTITHIAMEQLGDYLVSPEWEKRHAALMALVQIAEGSSKVMIKYLEKIVKMVLHSFQDPHPRVRWAAISATLQLSIDLCPDFQEQYHTRVLPALAASMDDFQNPRLQAQAACAIQCYFNCEKTETLVPYLDKILNKLLVILQNDNQMVNETALKALTFIVNFSKEDFLKYYDCVMPYLKAIIVNANDKYNHILRQYALECFSIVVKNVSKGKFRDDLEQLMEVLIKSLHGSQVKELDTIVYSLQACYRICIGIGKDFLPYMSTVMPPLIECAQLEPDKTVSDKSFTFCSIHKVEFGDQIILARRKDLLEAKAKACLALGRFAWILEEDFYPWISQAASILVPLLKFYIHDEVRKNASYGIPRLLCSAKLAVEKGTAQGGNMPYFKQLSGEIIHTLVDALHLEPVTKICIGFLRELNECLKTCGPLLNEDQIHSVIDMIKHVLAENSHRKGELAEIAKSEDFDAEDAELMRDEREQEAEVFSKVGDILMTLIETFKAAFLPFLDELSSYLMPKRGEDKIAKERKTCILIFDDVMEHCSEAAIKYHDIYLPFLLDSCNDEDPGVRQAALYGLVLCAEYGGYSFKPFIEVALSRINVVITHFKALEHKNIWAYDNAVSALGKICQFHRESIDSAQTIHAWLNCLPIKTALDEAKVVHDQLCSMVKRSDKELLGPNGMHIPKVISVFAEVLCAGDDLASKETREHMINLLRHFHKTLPPATWESARSLLLPQQEMELESSLSPTEEMLTFQNMQ